MHRRSLLATLGVAAVGGLAGCPAPGIDETESSGRTATPDGTETLDGTDRPDELGNPSFEEGYRGWLGDVTCRPTRTPAAQSPRARASRPTP